MRSDVIDIVWSVIDNPKLGTLGGEPRVQNGRPDRETEENAVSA
jgi:hypothetical protein